MNASYFESSAAASNDVNAVAIAHHSPNFSFIQSAEQAYIDIEMDNVQPSAMLEHDSLPLDDSNRGSRSHLNLSDMEQLDYSMQRIDLDFHAHGMDQEIERMLEN